MMPKYSFIKQFDSSDCGPASLYIILKQLFNIDLPIGEISNIVNANANGTNFFNIKKGIEKNIGITSEVLQCERQVEVFEEIKYPFLTQINRNGENHFVVIHGHTKKCLYIADPLEDRVKKIKKSDFLGYWIPFVLIITGVIDNERLQDYSFKRPSILKNVLLVKWYIVLSWVLSILIVGMGIIFAGMFTVYFDMIIPNKFAEIIVQTAIFYIILVSLKLILNYINAKITIKINNKIDQKLISQLLSSFFNKDFSIIEKYKSGELITRFTNVSQIRERMIYLIQSMPIDLFIVLITMFILLRFNFYLSLLVLIPMISFLLILYLSQERIEKLSNKLFEYNEVFNTSLIESIDNIEILKGYLVTEKSEEKINKRLKKLLKTSEDFFAFEILQSNLKNSLLELFNILVFSLGAYLVINDNIASGILLMFNSLAMNVFNPFLRLTSLQATLQQGKVATKRYEDILYISNRKDDGEHDIERVSNLKISNLSFSYEINNYILQGLNLEVRNNTNIAIIGDSGSGKTTLGKLIANYYPIEHGTIEINNMSYDTIRNGSIREKVLFVPQNIQLFSDTITQNITVGRQIDVNRIIEESRSIGFDSIARSFPKGYDTVIGKNGVNLSMGQTQLLNILRAILSDTEIRIFDEITNGLDLTKKQRVIDYLLKNGNINIFITHDIDLAFSCDEIYVIHKGNLMRMEKDKEMQKEDILRVLNDDDL
ncbi:ABC transporter transmembrane domain-containing protein [Ornithinibacillus sp. 179-J 7C1 HS]